MMHLNLIKPDVRLQPYIKTYWHLKVLTAPNIGVCISSLNRFFLSRLLTWTTIPSNNLLRIETSLLLCQSTELPATSLLAESACLSPKQYRRLFLKRIT